MSRSNPNEHAPNPATRYFEWSGKSGEINYYDKDTKSRKTVNGFVFLVLDELATVRGWDNETDCGIYANEVRDTRVESLTVKSKKGGVIAAGLYKSIRDRVGKAGGYFVGVCYLAYKQADGTFAIGVLHLKGAALMAWSNFRRDNRANLLKGAVAITGFTEGKKGSVTYRVPVFAMKPASEPAQSAAIDLDKELQAWLTAYFARKTVDRVDPESGRDEGHYDDGDSYDDGGTGAPDPSLVGTITDDDIPF